MYLNASHASSVENGRMISYIELYKHIAIQEMHRTHIPASIKLAQAILESQAGSSTLAVKANNHFGIKCGDKWNGKTYYIKDDDYDKHGNHIQSCFRVYSDATESFMAHSNFISGEGRTTNRYASLFALAQDDYKGWAVGLQKAGYATHPMYSRRLVSIIDDYRLHAYDVKAFVPTPNAPPGFFMDKEKSPFTKVNGLKSVFVDHMASPAELAIDFNIPVDLIMRYNEILADENAPINVPMYVFLEKKKKKSVTKQSYHIVEGNETLEYISQKYGIQVKYLYRRNRLKEGSQPAAGSKILLSRKSKYAPNLALPAPEMDITAIPTPQPIPVTPVEPTENAIKTNQSVRKPLEQTMTSVQEEQTLHTVKEKDTLYSIARKYSTTVANLKAINQLEQDAIKIGQQLKVN